MSYSAFGSVGARGSEGYSQALAQGRIPQAVPVTQLEQPSSASINNPVVNYSRQQIAD
jgi:hypothetical protein